MPGVDSLYTRVATGGMAAWRAPTVSESSPPPTTTAAIVRIVDIWPPRSQARRETLSMTPRPVRRSAGRSPRRPAVIAAHGAGFDARGQVMADGGIGRGQLVDGPLDRLAHRRPCPLRCV